MMLFLHGSYSDRRAARSGPPGPADTFGQGAELRRHDDRDAPLYLQRVERHVDFFGTSRRERTLLDVPSLRARGVGERMKDNLYVNRLLFPVGHALQAGANWLSVGIILPLIATTLAQQDALPPLVCAAFGATLGVVVGVAQYWHLQRLERAEQKLGMLCALLTRMRQTDDPAQVALMAGYAEELHGELRSYCDAVRGASSRINVAAHAFQSER